jgi:phosphate-selective porin OprO/OprP
VEAMMKVTIQIAICLFWTTVCWGQSSETQATPVQRPIDSAQELSVYDRIWKFAQWYGNKENPAIQNLLFTGRFQHDYAVIDTDQGSYDEWNVRRLRVGLKSQLFRTFTLHGEVELNPQEADPVYTRITDFYLQWSKSGAFALTVGKHSGPFTMDGATSSRELLAADRSNLSNNMWFPQEYFPGISVAGQRSHWIYRAGVYSAGRANKEFGRFSGSVFTLAVIGYDLAESLGVGEAVLAGNYVYQNPDVNNTFTRQLHHMLSVNLKLEDGRWGVRTDVSRASGYLSQSDLWGSMVMPFVNVTEKLQFVGRHTYLKSDDANGVQFATYESRVAPGRGDEYNEFYVGANYYFYGHKLKLQSGVQFADMNDRATDGGAHSGVSWTSGLRVGW